jgi:hypothetical protein
MITLFANLGIGFTPKVESLHIRISKERGVGWCGANLNITKNKVVLQSDDSDNQGAVIVFMECRTLPSLR